MDVLTETIPKGSEMEAENDVVVVTVCSYVLTIVVSSGNGPNVAETICVSLVVRYGSPSAA